MDWIRGHTEGVIGWAVMLLTLIFSLGQLSADLTGEIRHMSADITTTAAKVDAHTSELAEIHTDVEVLKEQADRSAALMDRQEESIRSLDRLVVEVKTLVRANHGR